VPVDRIADDFGRLCLECDAIGTRVVLEPMPCSTIPTLEMAGAIVVGAGQPHGCIVLDTWHIADIELDDGCRAVVVDLLDDTANRRKLCGEGEHDVPGFLRAVRAAGDQGPYGVEILSEEHRSLPVDVQAGRSFETASPSSRSVPELPRASLPFRSLTLDKYTVCAWSVDEPLS
jgi:sugar phosphate isomerase/epimerase